MATRHSTIVTSRLVESEPPGVACFGAEWEYFFLDLIKSESGIGVGFLNSVKLGIEFLITYGDFNLR